MNNNSVTTLQDRQIQGKALLQNNLSNIMKAVNGDSSKVSKFQASILNMLTDKNLEECSVASIIKCGINIIQLGLDPNKAFGQAYVVPFGNKKDENGEKQAQLQIGYKGFINLAYRNDWIFKEHCVYKCDKFSIDFDGFDEKISFKANYEKRDNENAEWVFENLKGVIVLAKDGKGNTFIKFVPKAKLDKLRAKSETQQNAQTLTTKSRNGYDLVWGQWTEEMYIAKALKYVATRLPITESMQRAISLENEPYANETNNTAEYVDAVVVSNTNEIPLIQQVINLADGKNVPIERVTEAFGKTDITELTNQELTTAKKRLENTPRKEKVA